KPDRSQRQIASANPNLVAVVSRRHHAPRAEGPWARRTRLTTTTQRRRISGETNREYAPSGAQNPCSHVVPPSTPSTTPPTPAVKSAFEMNPARQSPNTPDMISIARGNELNTLRPHTKSFSPDVSRRLPEPAIE